MTASEIVRFINQRHGSAYQLGARYRGGEGPGAYRLSDGGARRFVLKFSDGVEFRRGLERAAAATSRLRALGYPAPAYLLTGETAEIAYAVQEALPGLPMKSLRAEHLARVLELNEMQSGQGDAAAREWPARVTDPVMAGGNGFCILDTMRQYSPETSALLLRLQAIASDHANECPDVHDLVHYDFNPANILVDHRRISGVIDWEAVGSGDRAFDLVTLLFYSYETPEMRARLWRYLREHAKPRAIMVYLSHMALRQVEWSIRLHDRATIEHFLRISENALNDASG